MEAIYDNIVGRDQGLKHLETLPISAYVGIHLVDGGFQIALIKENEIRYL